MIFSQKCFHVIDWVLWFELMCIYDFIFNELLMNYFVKEKKLLYWFNIPPLNITMCSTIRIDIPNLIWSNHVNKCLSEWKLSYLEKMDFNNTHALSNAHMNFPQISTLISIFEVLFSSFSAHLKGLEEISMIILWCFLCFYIYNFLFS